MQKSLLEFLGNSSSKKESGQIAIVVLLVMVVLLILGLSLARRTSEEILLSGQTEDTTRVFNAAETGIEEALSIESNFVGTSADGTGSLNSDVGYKYDVAAESDWEQELQENQAATVYLDGDPSEITIGWNKNIKVADCDQKAALIISIYYDDGNSVVHEAWRPDCYGSNKAAGFTDISDNDSQTFTNSNSIDLSSYTDQVFARIRPIYASTYLSVAGTGLPDQTYKITSTGTESNPDGRAEQRTIEVIRTKPAPPSVFDYALYSGGTLEKP